MMEMEYEKMLDRLYLSLPKETLSRERFVLPKPESFVQGQKTIVRNFNAILKLIKRDKKHLFKFIAKEIGTAASVDEGRLILNGKFGEEQVGKLFNNYVNQFVLCPECKKPDTGIVEKHGIKMMKCEACGALSSVKNL